MLKLVNYTIKKALKGAHSCSSAPTLYKNCVPLPKQVVPLMCGAMGKILSLLKGGPERKSLETAVNKEMIKIIL